MKFTPRVAISLMAAFILLSPVIARAQTLAITNGIQTYGALTNTTVTMTGNSELRVTASSNAIPGCLIHLNSSNAWFYLPNIRPSVVASTYLGQIRVNGAVAVSDSNVRVAQYDMGTIVIPHSPSFQSLQVFSGPNFLGASNKYSLYTYYTDTGLGVQNNNISSFRLKRGYMATFAQNANGTGVSKTYVAQDGDLDVGVLPENLDDSISFVRVFPWRWSGKKGWAGGVEPLVDPLWNYDWDNATTSTLNTEYVPMRHNSTWNAYANINNKQKSTHALGFNEPDKTDQANMTVAQAIAAWPNLLASGLRLGSPAPSDAAAGLTWLYDFMDQAEALDYRVDFAAVHFYKGGWSASQLTNWCREVYTATGRPVWVTEFNNGANWTCCEPTLASQATIMGQFIEALDNAPYVERYSIYNWVGTNRAMINGGALTPAGVVYRDNASPLAYTQELPAGGARSVAQFSFEGNPWDGSGFGNNGFVQGIPAYTAGTNGQAMEFDGADDFVKLPTVIGDSTDFSFAAWVYWNGGGSFQRIFDFGNGTGQYLFLTPSSGGGKLRFAIKNGGGEQAVETTALTPGQWTHVAVTLGGDTGMLYINGVSVASSNNITINPSSLNTTANYLGESQFPADPLFSGKLDNVLITDYALSAAQIAAMQTNLPPQFPTNILSRTGATDSQAYSNSIAGTATDPNGDALTYGKVGGPTWLTVAGDGTLGGTPGTGDRGTNSFTISATDAAGMSAFAMLNIYVNTKSNVMARYDFENNTLTSIGTAHGTLTGTGTYVAGHTGQAIDLDGAANYVTVPAGLADSDGFTFAAWVNWDGGGAWQRIFDFGNGANQYLFLTPSSGDGTLRFAIKNGGSEQKVETAALPAGQWRHVAFTLSGTTGRLYTNGVLVVTSNSFSITPSSFNPVTNYLGKSQFADPLFSGRLDEVFIANYGLSAAQVALLVTNHAPQFTNGALARPNATEGSLYTNSIAGTATDIDAGDVLAYSKSAGPAWLVVAGSGALTGTPAPGDVGTNTFTVSVADSAGASVAATLTVVVVDAPNPVVTLTNSDVLGSSSFNSAGNWDSGAAPTAFADYFTSIYALRTPEGTSDHTFAGNSLTFPPNATATGSMIFKGGGTRTYTFNRLFPGGGMVRSGSGSQDTCILAGNITLISATTSTILADQSPFVLAAPINGGGSLVTTGGFTTTFSGPNTYSGDTLVKSGTLKANAGPVLYLSFDSAGATTVTNNGSGGSLMNGTLTGAGATVVSGGRYGKALSVNGTAAYVLITNKVANLDCTTGGAAWTYALWLKTATAGAKFGYQGNGGWNTNAQTTFYLNGNSTAAGGTKVGGVRYADNWLTGSNSVNDNAWHFITITVSGGYKKIYVDGNLDAQTGATGWNAAGSLTANQFWIGGSPDTGDGTANLNGLIDEVYVFNRALSQTEVQNLMTVTNAVVAGVDRTLSPNSLVTISGGATVDLNGSTQVIPGVTGSGTVNTLVVGGAATLVISNNTDCSFSGVLANTSGTLALSKTAPGKFTLTGNNNYAGATRITDGTLLVNGLLPSSAVTVSGTGIIGGTGSLGGAVTVQSGGAIAPGTSLGRLTVSNSVTLQPGGLAQMEINRSTQTNDVLRVTGTLNYGGGTLAVTNLAGTLAVGDSFILFQAGAISGNFGAYSLPTLNSGLGWNTSNLASGVLSVVQTVATNPTNILASVSGNTLSLSWPSGHTGWSLQSNSVSLVATDAWFTVPGSAATNQIFLGMDSTKTNVFFRLTWP